MSDGGGVRGISSLYILKYVMYELQEKEKLSVLPQPCDYFDMISGTSTGGLIAIMLGVLDMHIDTCIEKYEELAKEVFQDDYHFSQIEALQQIQAVLGANRFDHLKLEKIVKALVRSEAEALLPVTQGNLPTNLEDTPMNFRATPDGTRPKCKVFVCATAERLTASTLFRSYNLRGTAQAGNFPCCIWEACRATTAAPFFFAPVIIGPNRSKYCDGALNCNNPALMLKEEAASVWSNRKIGCLLSIGTGFQQLKDVFSGLKIVKAKVTETQGTHAALSKAYTGKRGYYRFDVSTGLDKILQTRSGISSHL
ncbi:hypothetical protein B7463_g4742, partial [Scytalidium lignicola]